MSSHNTNPYDKIYWKTYYSDRGREKLSLILDSKAETFTAYSRAKSRLTSITALLRAIQILLGILNGSIFL